MKKVTDKLAFAYENHYYNVNFFLLTISQN